MTAESSKALAHLRVLDISRVRAGPTCCRILGDFGADIIKIEAPAGVDPNEGISGARDGYDMLNLHRNKRSLTLNLKERSGHDIFMRLVKDPVSGRAAPTACARDLTRLRKAWAA
jgi:crotonobetainyl-CoA:carnitine CoA-transferase CaiB-like acyl-CoA transferase